MKVLLFLFFSVLITASYQDIKKMEIENGCHAAIIMLAVASSCLTPQIGLASRLAGAVCVSLPLLIITLIVQGAFGGGDIKLMAAGGLFLGWKLTVVAAIVGIFLGGIYVIFLMIKKKAGRNTQIAFGPFLCAGMAISALWGQQLIHWYSGL